MIFSTETGISRRITDTNTICWGILIFLMQMIKMLDTAHNTGNPVISLRNKINTVTGTTCNLIIALIQLARQEEKVMQHTCSLYSKFTYLPPSSWFYTFNILALAQYQTCPTTAGSLNPYTMYTILYIKPDSAHTIFLPIWTQTIILKHSLDIDPDLGALNWLAFIINFNGEKIASLSNCLSAVSCCCITDTRNRWGRGEFLFL